MKSSAKLILSAITMFAAATTQAEMVKGYFRQNGTYVAPHYRTPANSTPFDNLSYRGYPSQQPGYVSPSSSSFGSANGLGSSYSRQITETSSAYPTQLPSFKSFGSGAVTLPYQSRDLSTFGFDE